MNLDQFSNSQLKQMMDELADIYWKNLYETGEDIYFPGGPFLFQILFERIFKQESIDKTNIEEHDK